MRSISGSTSESLSAKNGKCEGNSQKPPQRRRRKPVPYDPDEASLLIEKYREKSVETSQKVSVFQKKASEKKIRSEFSRHRHIWVEENKRLQAWADQLEAEMRGNPTQLGSGELISSFPTCKQMDERIYEMSMQQEEIWQKIFNIRREKNRVILIFHQNGGIVEGMQRSASEWSRNVREMEKDLGQMQLELEELQNVSEDELAQLLPSVRLGKPSSNLAITEIWDFARSSGNEWLEACLEGLARLDAQFVGLFEFLKSEYKHVVSIGCTGGWSNEQHSKYVKLRDEYSGETNGRFEMLYQRCRLEGLVTSHGAFSEHYEWHSQYTLYEQKKRHLKAAWHKEQAVYVDHARKSFMREKEEFEKQVLRQRELEQISRADVKRKCKLNALKVLRSRKEEIRKEKESELRRIVEQEELRRQQRAMAEREISKRHLELYKAEQRMQQEERDEIWLEMLIEVQADRVVQRMHNETRTTFRKCQLQDKRKRAIQKLQEKEKEKEEQSIRLAALRAQVAIFVEADMERAIGPTTASTNSIDMDGPGMHHDLFPRYTFSTDEILSDPRSKMLNALHECGLAQSTYGRQVFDSIRPTKLSRPDQRSTLVLGCEVK